MKTAHQYRTNGAVRAYHAEFPCHKALFTGEASSPLSHSSPPFQRNQSLSLSTWQSWGSGLTGKVAELRLLALVPAEMQNRIRRQLAPLSVTIDFLDQAAGWSRGTHGKPYQVALIPAMLPDLGWWSLWSEIVLLDPRPEIVVYAQHASFTLWSGVLEMGGYDVIVEPFTGNDLQGAVLRAAHSFVEGRRKALDLE